MRKGEVTHTALFSPYRMSLFSKCVYLTDVKSWLNSKIVNVVCLCFRSHFRPHSPSPTSDKGHHYGSSSFSKAQDSSEFNMDHFTSHQEQLLQMQREQQEQLLRHQTCDLDTSFTGLEHSFSSQPTSRFTLDTASAKFAVSAVINSTQVQQQQSATSTATINGASSISTSTINLLNGPITTISDSKSWS